MGERITGERGREQETHGTERQMRERARNTGQRDKEREIQESETKREDTRA